MSSVRANKLTVTVSTAAIMALGLGACGADGVAGVSDRDALGAGTHMRAYDVRIDARNSYDGALMFDVADAAVDSVTSIVGVVFRLDVASEVGADVSARVVYSGALQDGVVATLWLGAGSDVPRVTLQQAAAGVNRSKLALDEFTVTTSAR